MTRLRGHMYARHRSVRGVAFLYFTILAMPLLFFSAAAAVDFTKIIVASRQVSNATAAAALSGAWQMQTGRAAVNSAQATNAAVETYCVARAVKAVNLASNVGSARTCPGGGTASVSVALKDYRASTGGLTSSGYTTVEVTTRYKVDGLVFFSFFGAGKSFTAPPVTRSASICVPGDKAGSTDGFCQRPTD